MKKYFVLCAVLFCAAMPCRALDLILKNGETLYNITNVTPLFTRVHLVTHPPDGTDGDWGIMVRTVRYSDLMEQSLADLQNYLVMRGRSLPANVWNPLKKSGEPVTINAILPLRGGTVGYLNGTTQQVFIRGLLIPPGSIWHGFIEPERGFFFNRGIALPVYQLRQNR